MITTRKQLKDAIKADIRRYRRRHPRILGYFLADESYRLLNF